MTERLAGIIDRHLRALVEGHPDRHVGRPGNAPANDYVEAVLHGHCWRVTSDEFEALDCEQGTASLRIDGRDFAVQPGPYTLPVDADAPLLSVDSLAALEEADLGGAIVLLRGGIAADQLFPKSFTFLDVPDHRRIDELLEDGRPAAIVSATGRGSGLAGGLYPYPLIEDGDFDIPNAYTSDVTGEELVVLAGRSARLVVDSQRFTVPARQLDGERGPSGAPRVVIIAHIDSKPGSPGAVDNAAGVAALLAVARLLDDDQGPEHVQLLPMNGEDYYANSGEHLFVAANEGRWEEIVGVVNMDAIGGRGAATAVSMYGLSEAADKLVRRVARRHSRVSVGEEWYEGDHSIIIGKGRPAIAMTSTNFRDLCATVTHTGRDTLGVVDPAVVAEATEFVADLVRALPAVGGIET